MLYSIPLIILVLAMLSKGLNGSSKEILYRIAVIILLLFSALRNAFLYPDIDGYYDYFRGQYMMSEENFGYGYMLLNKVCHSLSDSFQFVLVIISGSKRYVPILF